MVVSLLASKGSVDDGVMDIFLVLEMTGEGDIILSIILSHLISSYLILPPLSYQLGYPSFPITYFTFIPHYNSYYPLSLYLIYIYPT